MIVTKAKIIELVLAEDNVRLHPSRQIEEYKRSLAMFGQTKNAVIDENNRVLIGNGLVIAAGELDWDEVDVVQRTDLSESQKLKLMISDNKIFGLGVDNLDTIDSIFEKLRGDLDIPGYDEETLQTMIAGAEEVSADIANYGILTPGEIDNIQNRPDARIPSPVNTPAPPPTNQPEEVENHRPAGGGEVNADDYVRVPCDKCGEFIWLLKDALRQLM